MNSNIGIVKRALFISLMIGLFFSGSSLFFSARVSSMDVDIAHGSGDLAKFHVALKQVEEENWTSAAAAVALLHDPIYRKIFQWLYYQDSKNKIEFAEISKFMRANPDWPRQATLRLRAESAITEDMEPYELVLWFQDYAPQTPSGMRHYLKALERLNRKSQIRTVLREWWQTALLSPKDQEYFIEHYGYYLNRPTHIQRIDRLLDAQHYTNAKSIARQLGMGYPRLVEARIALAEDKSGVDQFVDQVPDYLKNNEGLLYERIRWRRRHDKEDSAIELLLEASKNEDVASSTSKWWRERHILVRHLIEQKKFEEAYQLAASHGQKDGFSMAQAEFVAGWLALRFVNKPKEGFEHFETLYHNVSTPISRARGAYWAGLASYELGHPDIAREWYRTAARYQTTFYGQLAVAALDDRYKPPQQLPPARDTQMEKRFEQNELVIAAKILSRADFRKEATIFLNQLSETVQTPQDYLLVADLSGDLGHFHNGIRIAKNGLQKDIFLMDHAYPTIVSRLRHVEDVEWALVHALIRQESAFDYKARSGAGARGLMQLMPATAKDVARGLKVSHRTSWLTSRPSHNIKLGSTYIRQMLDRFDGSYPLALAAYNAGPSRVDRWLKTYGDPRKNEISMVDWIEMIPIYETRNYVQRVLESVYVYRLKLRHIQKDVETPIHVSLSHETL